jgi:CBS domain-containing protein
MAGRAKTVREVMTTRPVSVKKDTPVAEAARAMLDRDIGDVIVTDGEGVYGIVTDRDIVVRAIADGKDPNRTKVGEVASPDVETIPPDTTIENAVGLMRDKAIRRLPVVEDGRPIGIVTIGDLAEVRDPNSALADISAAPPNN